MIDSLLICDFQPSKFSPDLLSRSMFSAPNNRSDVILVVEGKKIVVSKEYLSIHSPVFEAMFFGEYAEKNKDEIELKDIVYEEFIDLLNVAYLDTKKITDRTVPHILKLADFFQIERVVKRSEKHLIRLRTLDNFSKFLLADRYNLASLKHHLLQSYTNVDALRVLKSFDDFSVEMKAAICDRIFDLIN